MLEKRGTENTKKTEGEEDRTTLEWGGRRGVYACVGCMITVKELRMNEK